MKFIINNTLYDTKKMEYIGKVIKPLWLAQRICKLWRSKNGIFLLTWGNNATTIGENHAKELLRDSNAKAYLKVFGYSDLEEA